MSVPERVIQVRVEDGGKLRVTCCDRWSDGRCEAMFSYCVPHPNPGHDVSDETREVMGFVVSRALDASMLVMQGMALASNSSRRDRGPATQQGTGDE